MIKFHDIKNKNLFDLCPPSVDEQKDVEIELYKRTNVKT